MSNKHSFRNGEIKPFLKLFSYAVENGIKERMPKDEEELRARIKQLERQLKDKERVLERQKKVAEDEKLNVEILKKSLHIFMQPPE